MSKPIVRTHSCQHFEELQLSSKEFYSTLESLVASYQFPKVTCNVVEKKEDSFMSASRQYLQIEQGVFSYLVCAAPFGKSFFISWYLEETDDNFTIALRKIPILRWLVSSDKTYYQIDSELMFKKSIDAIVQQAINKIKAEHGFRQPEIEIAN